MKKLLFIIIIIVGIFVTVIYAADTKTSALVELTDVDDADIMYIVDAGTSKRITVLNLFDTINSLAELNTIVGATLVSEESTPTLDALWTFDLGLTITTGDPFIFGVIQWDNGSDLMDGERIADDTIDNDSIDWGDMADLTTDGAVVWGNITAGELADDTVNNDDINWGDIDNLGDEGTITVADTADATSYVALWESATGDLAAKSDAALLYAADTGTLAATEFSGGGAGITGLSVLYNNIGDPGASGSISFDAAEGATYTSGDDQWVGVTISNTQADNAGDTELLTLAFTDDGDTNSHYLIMSDAAGTQQLEFIQNGADVQITVAGDLKFIATGGDFDFADDDITTTGTIAGTTFTENGNAVISEAVATAGLIFGDSTPDADGEIAFDTTGDGSTVTAGVLDIHDGTEVVHYFGSAGYPTGDNQILKYDAGTNKVIWEVDAGAAGGDEWGDAVDSDILPTGYDNTYDLGSAAASFKDGYFEGTLEAGTLTEGGQAVWNATETDILDSGHYIAGSIDEEHLNVTNAPGAGEDNYVLTYNHAATNFTWAPDADSGGSTKWNAIDDADGVGSIDFVTYTQTIDIGVTDVDGPKSGLVLDVTGLGVGTTDVIALEITTVANGDTDYIPIAIYDDSGSGNDLLFKVIQDGGIWTSGDITFSDGAVFGAISNALTFTEGADTLQLKLNGAHFEFIIDDGFFELESIEASEDTLVKIKGYDSREQKGILQILSNGADKYIELYHDDTDAHIISSSGDIHIEANGGDVLFADDNITTTGTIEGATLTEGGVAVINATQGGTWTGTHDFGGANLEIPQASPAVPSVDGEIEFDFTDGSLVIQHSSAHTELGSPTDVVVGKLIRCWGGTIFEPDAINDVMTVKAINSIEFPHGVVITAIYLGVSENTSYTLTVQNFDDFDTINGVNGTIDAVTYTADTTGEIIDTSPTYDTIAAGQLIMISIPSTDVDWIHFEIYYYEPAAD